MTTSMVQPYHGSYLMPSFEHATVSDAMHPGILTCEPDATLTEVARLMATHRVHSIAVMGISHESSVEKLVWGIISDLDLLRASLGPSSGTTASALARQEIVTVEPTMPLREAGELMLTHRVSHLVVTNPELQRPIGILSTLDVAGVLAWGEG